MSEQPTKEEPVKPHPYACQIKDCRGRIGQEIVNLGPRRGQIRVCLYHYVLLQSEVYAKVTR
jgi:hypothetical protein